MNLKIKTAFEKAEPKLRKAFKKLKRNIRSNGDKIQILSDIYSFTDKYWCDFFCKYSSCRPSCSYCCKMNIELTLLEAKYISINMKYPVNLNNLYSLPQEGEHRVCPFLSVEENCQIYDYRPFSCRCHFAFTDPGWCDISKGMPTKNVNFNCNEVMLELAEIIASMNDGFDPHYSIHSFFPFDITVKPQ